MADKRDQILITLDSLRWDVFELALDLKQIPFLKNLGKWEKCLTHGSYTFPAHHAMFMGKLPCNNSKKPLYDNQLNRVKEHRPRAEIWRIATERKGHALQWLNGKTILEGFKNEGYKVLGTGAVAWFDSDMTNTFAHIMPWSEYRFFGKYKWSGTQIDWMLERVSRDDQPVFMFLNFGETHHPYIFRGCDWDDKWPIGNKSECFGRQTLCLKYLDHQINRLFSELSKLNREFDFVICADHGDCFGEDEHWGHGYAHPVVMDVPMLAKVCI